MSEAIRIVFGAADPESAAGRKLAQAAGIVVHQAMAGSKPVHPGSAYAADAVDPPIPDDGSRVLRWECDGPAFAGVDPTRITVIDHHRPGDPGYGRPPEEFLAASSIGQVLTILAAEIDLPGQWAREDWLDGDFGIMTRMRDRRTVSMGETVEFSEPWGIIPTAEVMMIAAADHCLEAAYRGRCPGVDPDALMRWRVESKAAFQGRSVEAILSDVEAARKRLIAASTAIAEIGCTPAGDMLTRDFRLDYADLRGESIPELPEAACREGIPFLATVQDRDGRTKVVLQAATPQLIRRFMAGEIVRGLEDYYGDPARGFAGGYQA